MSGLVELLHSKDALNDLWWKILFGKNNTLSTAASWEENNLKNECHCIFVAASRIIEFLPSVPVLK